MNIIKRYISFRTVTTTTGGGIQSVVAGTNITVDNTDPLNPIINATGGGGSVQSVTGDGVNNTDPTNPVMELVLDRTVTTSGAILQSDHLKIVYFNSATAINFTLNQLLIRTQVSFINLGAGTVTFLNGAGVSFTGFSTLSTGQTAGIVYRTATAPVIMTNTGGIDPVQTLTGDTTLTPIPAQFVCVDTTGGDVTIQLYSPDDRGGYKVTVKKIVAANTLTVTTASGTIDDSASAVMTVKDAAIDFFSDGSNWKIK